MDCLKWETAEGGLARAVISSPLAEAEIYQQGAHIAQWAPCGQRPVLFLSARSVFAAGKPIRGGVPVIFPWFGARSDGGQGPAHGFARTEVWSIESARAVDTGAVEVVFGLEPDETSRALEFDRFAVRFTVGVGTELSMALEVRNLSGEVLIFEEALHTYFAISDIHDIAVHGLEGTVYIDKTDGMARKTRPNEPIRFAKETDQVHVNTEATCAIEDPGWGRRITIEKTGSLSTVVWNPWIAKTATMADMAPDEWPGMVCIETANAAENAVHLGPGESHTMTVRISI
jgi:glucose-6-phosphate 1-epimerase